MGRVKQDIIAVCGCQGAGKSVYQWAVLHRLREALGGHPDSPASVMFEHDAGYEYFRLIDQDIRAGRGLPGGTDPVKQRNAEFWDPVVVRLLRSTTRRNMSQANLIFYDHAGELIQSLDDSEYLRYLAHSAAIVYLVDPANAELAREGLNAVVQRIRTHLRMRGTALINRPLAIGISKADETLLNAGGAYRDPGEVLPDHGAGPGFWKSRRSAIGERIRRTSETCEQFLQDHHDLHSLTALARNSFQTVRYFAVSSLGTALNQRRQLSQAPEPVGVEHPLLWLMSQLS